MTKHAEVVAHSIRTALGEVAVVVTVTCPNGCRDRRRPATHTHGWTSTTANGGERGAHCGSGAPAYRLVWPGDGPPADVLEALNRTENR